MTIAIDQANAGEFINVATGTTIPVTTTQTVAVGGFIVCTFCWNSTGSPTLSSVSGGGLTWTIDTQYAGAGVNSTVAIAVVSAQAPAGLASSTTITGTLSSTATGRSVAVTSFTGVLASSPVDTTDRHDSPTATAAWTSNSLSISAGSVIVSCAFDIDNGNTSTVTSPSVEAHDFNDGLNNIAQTTCYRIEASSGSYTVAGAWSAPINDGSVASVAYRVAVGKTPFMSLPFIPQGRML